MNLIFSDNVHILCLFCKVKKPKTTAKLSKKSRNKRLSNSIWWCPLCSLCLYCYRSLPLLNINQVPEKLYLGQWLYMTKKLSSLCNLIAQIELVQDKQGLKMMKVQGPRSCAIDLGLLGVMWLWLFYTLGNIVRSCECNSSETVQQNVFILGRIVSHDM